MGIIIASGMTIGTAFTLYVLPAFYLFIGRDYGKQQIAVPVWIECELFARM